MVLNSLYFCLPIKLLISPSYLNEILAGYSNLGCRFFSFITLSMTFHSLPAWRVSIDRSAVILMGILLCVICCFFPCCFYYLLFCVWSLLVWLICVLGCFALGLSCLGLSGFLGLGSPTPQFKSINSSMGSFLYTPTLTSIYDYWKNHSFD